MFKITRSKGFRIEFANGYAVSVQWGWGDYCDHYDAGACSDIECGAAGSYTAEVAVFHPEEGIIEFPPFITGDIVAAYQTPEQVVEIMKAVKEVAK